MSLNAETLVSITDSGLTVFSYKLPPFIISSSTVESHHPIWLATLYIKQFLSGLNRKFWPWRPDFQTVTTRYRTNNLLAVKQGCSPVIHSVGPLNTFSLARCILQSCCPISTNLLCVKTCNPFKDQLNSWHDAEALQSWHQIKTHICHVAFSIWC